MSLCSKSFMPPSRCVTTSHSTFSPLAERKRAEPPGNLTSKWNAPCASLAIVVLSSSGRAASGPRRLLIHSLLESEQNELRRERGGDPDLDDQAPAVDDLRRVGLLVAL